MTVAEARNCLVKLEEETKNERRHLVDAYSIPDDRINTEAYMKWILFYYNSLPDVPPGCQIFSHEVMHRDFFKCNPSNTGHFQYPKFENMSYDDKCHRRQIQRFLREPSADKYVVFYTHHTGLARNGKNKLVGYFKVGKHDEHGFEASEAVLLPKDKCVDIDYNGRGVPVSWGNSKAKAQVEAFLTRCISQKRDDISHLYKSETEEIMRSIRTISGRKRLLETCGNCSVAESCYWGCTDAKNEQLDILYKATASC